MYATTRRQVHVAAGSRHGGSGHAQLRKQKSLSPRATVITPSHAGQAERHQLWEGLLRGAGECALLGVRLGVRQDCADVPGPPPAMQHLRSMHSVCIATPKQLLPHHPLASTICRSLWRVCTRWAWCASASCPSAWGRPVEPPALAQVGALRCGDVAVNCWVQGRAWRATAHSDGCDGEPAPGPPAVIVAVTA